MNTLKRVLLQRRNTVDGGKSEDKNSTLRTVFVHVNKPKKSEKN